jgi:hypothetical protein
MAVLRGAAGWIIRQAAAMQAVAGGRRWRACPPRWLRWRLRWRCEVWQGWQAVGALQVGQGWRWCVVIVGGGLLLAWSSGAVLAVLILPGAGGGRCDLLRLRGAGAVIVATATTPSACRAADPAGRTGGRREGGAKEKGQGGGAWCAAALAFCLHWRCDLLRLVRPGAYRGRWGSAPRSGAGLLALALIRAQRFRLATVPAGSVPAWHGLRWRCSIRCVFAVCRRGQILHFTG